MRNRFHRSVTAVLLSLLTAASGASGDELRNVKVGDLVPPFQVSTVSGGALDSAALRGKVVVLVYVSAEQQSSERALRLADAIGKEADADDLVVAFLTADVTRVGYFRAQRDRLGIRGPLGLDVARRIYGGLGLIVLPTTIVVDGEGRLTRVISSCKSDYEHRLRSYVLHALGRMSDAELNEALDMQRFDRDRPADRIARHLAAARILRDKGLLKDAENEINAALAIDPDHVDSLLDLASLYVDTERFEEAERIMSKVRASEPDNRRGKLMEGIVLYHLGRLDEAKAILDESLLLNPDPIRTHYYLGLIAEKRGEKDAAIMHFKESLSRLLGK